MSPKWQNICVAAYNFYWHITIPQTTSLVGNHDIPGKSPKYWLYPTCVEICCEQNHRSIIPSPSVLLFWYSSRLYLGCCIMAGAWFPLFCVKVSHNCMHEHCTMALWPTSFVCVCVLNMVIESMNAVDGFMCTRKAKHIHVIIMKLWFNPRLCLSIECHVLCSKGEQEDIRCIGVAISSFI